MGERNFPGKWLTDDCTASKDLRLALRKKYDIQSGAQFSTLLHENGWPKYEVYPLCSKCKSFVYAWISGNVPYCRMN